MPKSNSYIVPIVGVFILIFVQSVQSNGLIKTITGLTAPIDGLFVAKQNHTRGWSLARYLNPRKLALRSGSALIYDKKVKRILFRKDSYKKRPIASITKLMTAMVILDSKLSLNTPIIIRDADKDRVRFSKSKLALGSTFQRLDLLKLALAISENRAASALARTYPGGKKAFYSAMNKKARRIGLRNTRFVDATGLRKENVSTAFDLVRLVNAANRYPLIRELTTATYNRVYDRKTKKYIGIPNTNRLLRNQSWDIQLSKTGYTNDSGYCLTMISKIAGREVTMVFLNSSDKTSKYKDANKTRKWINKAYLSGPKTST